MRIEELMNRDVVSVAPEASLKDVAALLTAHGFSGLPVCDGEGHVLGVVSEADILAKERGYAAGRTGPLAWLLEKADGQGAKLAARTAGEAMTSPAVTIAPGAPVSQAARLMVERKVNRLPVVADGVLVGIVTRADLVRAFQRSDEEIEREIREDVLLRTLWISPEQVEVSVDEGEVTLGGKVATRTEAELIEAYVRRVPGVVEVVAELAWEVDDLARRTSARLPQRL